MTGFILANGELSEQILYPLLGIFFLACGSCALNQYQEQRTDGLMERTRKRPIPSGRMSPSVALFCSVLMILTGFTFLCRPPMPSLFLGLLALLWYNGVYTYLKRKTTFASVPGAIIGMIPPAIGWISGGGSLSDTGLWGLSLFFFLWQVPHFWILALQHAHDYEKVGFFSLRKAFSPEQIRNMISIWLLAAGCVCFCMPLFLIIRLLPIHLLLISATLWLLYGARFDLKPDQEASLKTAFWKLNLYALWVLLLLSADSLLNSAPTTAARLVAMGWK